jgi:predicted metalloprotease with PDZ domain
LAALNAVEPYDWATFLRDRLDADGPDARAPLDGLERGGYRLVYVEEPNADERAVNSNWGSDFRWSVGFSLTGATNRISGIRWGGPLFEAGIGAGWDLIAVGDRAGSPEALREAITAAKGGSEPIRLTIRNGQRVRTIDLAYHDGLRYPRLERIEGTRDRISDILTARRR